MIDTDIQTPETPVSTNIFGNDLTDILIESSVWFPISCTKGGPLAAMLILEFRGLEHLAINGYRL